MLLNKDWFKIGKGKIENNIVIKNLYQAFLPLWAKIKIITTAWIPLISYNFAETKGECYLLRKGLHLSCKTWKNQSDERANLCNIAINCNSMRMSYFQKQRKFCCSHSDKKKMKLLDYNVVEIEYVNYERIIPRLPWIHDYTGTKFSWHETSIYIHRILKWTINLVHRNQIFQFRSKKGKILRNF